MYSEMYKLFIYVTYLFISMRNGVFFAPPPCPPSSYATEQGCHHFVPSVLNFSAYFCNSSQINFRAKNQCVHVYM